MMLNRVLKALPEQAVLNWGTPGYTQQCLEAFFGSHNWEVLLAAGG